MAFTRLCFAVAVLAVLATTAALSAPASDGGRKFTTELTGEVEVNAQGVPNQGDLDGTGTAQITVNAGQQRVCWEITTAGIDAVLFAHIHSAQAGQNGPIVVDLSAAQNDTASGCSTVTRSLADSIRKAPQGFYVNVHTTAFPAGALRGQLGK